MREREEKGEERKWDERMRKKERRVSLSCGEGGREGRSSREGCMGGGEEREKWRGRERGKKGVTRGE